MGKHTYCTFRDETKNYIKCSRMAVAAYKGKPYCNTHLQKILRDRHNDIDFERVEKALSKHIADTLSSLDKGGAR